MSDIQFIIQNIRNKTEKLLANNQSLRNDILKLNNRVNELEKLLILQRETIKDLEEKNKMLKIANSLSSDSEDKKALKLKINEFIREIDRSMSLLND